MNEIVIIIGLPGSGKTFESEYYKSQGYEIYDDFLSTIYDGRLLRSIKCNVKVCINDPRLCYFPTYNRTISQIEKINKNISLILFKNEPEKCIINVSNRKYVDKIINNIEQYSKFYDIELYDNYPKIIKEVFNY